MLFITWTNVDLCEPRNESLDVFKQKRVIWNLLYYAGWLTIWSLLFTKCPLSEMKKIQCNFLHTFRIIFRKCATCNSEIVKFFMKLHQVDCQIWHCTRLRVQICPGIRLVLSDHYNDVIMSLMASEITSLTIDFSNVYLGAYQRKNQGSASLRGIHRGTVNSPHKRPATRKMPPFDDVIIQQAFFLTTVD